MAGLAFLSLHIKDDETFIEYREKMWATLDGFGGEVLARGEVIDTFNAERPEGRNRMLVIRFPGVDGVMSWLNAVESSDEYESLRQLRGRMGTVAVTIVDDSLHT